MLVSFEDFQNCYSVYKLRPCHCEASLENYLDCGIYS